VNQPARTRDLILVPPRFFASGRRPTAGLRALAAVWRRHCKWHKKFARAEAEVRTTDGLNGAS
jgi:hypothetical protein